VMKKWPSVGPYIFAPCIRECECGVTWMGEPDEKIIGLYWPYRGTDSRLEP
jgi:hypothetical protein